MPFNNQILVLLKAIFELGDEFGRGKSSDD